MARTLYQVRVINKDGSARIYGGNLLFTTIKDASIPMLTMHMIPVIRTTDRRNKVREYYDFYTQTTWRIVDNDLAREPIDPKTADIVR